MPTLQVEPAWRELPCRTPGKKQRRPAGNGSGGECRVTGEFLLRSVAARTTSGFGVLSFASSDSGEGALLEIQTRSNRPKRTMTATCSSALQDEVTMGEEVLAAAHKSNSRPCCQHDRIEARSCNHSGVGGANQPHAQRLCQHSRKHRIAMQSSWSCCNQLMGPSLGRTCSRECKATRCGLISK